MKQKSKIKKWINQFLLFLLVCLVCVILSPEVFIFIPDVFIYLDISGLEGLITFLFMFLKPVRNKIEVTALFICRNKYFKKYGMLLIFVLIAPYTPELFQFIEVVGVCLLLTCMLMKFKSDLEFLAQSLRIS